MADNVYKKNQKETMKKFNEEYDQNQSKEISPITESTKTSKSSKIESKKKKHYEQDLKVELKSVKKIFLTENTYVGLKSTLKSTLKLSKFLRQKNGYLFVMTNRFNQNNLEKFFGIMRAHCGTHDHPNSLLFIQLYRLLSVYALIKPPRGSNINDTNVLDLLICNRKKDKKPKDSENLVELVGRKKFNSSIGKVVLKAIENVPDTSTSPQSAEKAVKNLADTSTSLQSAEKTVENVPDSTSPQFAALQYFCGYLAHKDFNGCELCKKTLSATTMEEKNYENSIIKLRDRYGVLHMHYPSKNLLHTTNVIEKVILDSVENLKKNSIFDIGENLLEFNHEEGDEVLSLLGCSCTNHALEFTSKVIQFYVIVRMHFILKIVNKNCKDAENTKNKRKQSKY